MQELVISILLTVVIIMAAVLLIFIGCRKDGMTKKQRVMMVRILISAGILLAFHFISAEMFDAVDRYLFPSAGRWLRFACYLIDYLIIGYDILKKAAKGIKNRQVFDESFLMAVATIGAMALAVYENGEYLEAIAVMLFYQIGEWFQGYAVGKSRRNISNLMDIYSCITGKEYDAIEREFDGKGYGEFKLAVGEAVADSLKPLKARYEELLKDKAYLDSMIKNNDEKAQYYATKTLRKVQKKVGLTERIR